MTAKNIANMPATQATFFEAAALTLMQGSITCNGQHSLDQHAAYAVKAAEALVNKLAQRAAAGGA